MRYATILASLATAVAGAKDERTFAVLYFQGDKPVTEGRVDPIVNPGGPAGHVHTFQGASGISTTSTGEDLKKSSCSSANIEGDMSAYWAPSVYFHDRANSSFEKVELFYMKVYYFFDPTDDEMKPFPTGLQMLAGNASLKTPPATANNVLVHGSEDPIQPVQFVCPRSDDNKKSGPRLYPENSDGSSAGMAVLRKTVVNGKDEFIEAGEGAGFPGANCDGYASPLRADIHFPSCYDPSKGLTDYKNNMAYPTNVKGKHNCPPGWVHVPHLFYELYWDTPKFAHRWTPGKDSQPFCLANGDCKGYSLHADFLAGWDEPLLQNIINTCDEGNGGMNNCKGVTQKDKSLKCTAPNPFPETIAGVMKSLPGNNAWYDFGAQGAGSGASDPKPSVDSKANPQPVADAKSEPKAGDVAQQPGVGGAKAAAAPAPTPASASAPVPTSFITTFVTTVTAASSESSKTTPAPVEVASPSSTVDSDPSHKQSVKPSVLAGELEGWKYAGCFRDTASRAIIGDKFPKLNGVSNENCINHCKSKGFTVAGTENGGQCFCGNEVANSEKIDEGECKSTCQGAPSTFCGGTWALTVYSQNGSIKP